MVRAGNGCGQMTSTISTRSAGRGADTSSSSSCRYAFVKRLAGSIAFELESNSIGKNRVGLSGRQVHRLLSNFDRLGKLPGLRERRGQRVKDVRVVVIRKVGGL